MEVKKITPFAFLMLFILGLGLHSFFAFKVLSSNHDEESDVLILNAMRAFLISRVVLLLLFLWFLYRFHSYYIKIGMASLVFVELIFTLLPISMALPSFQMANWVIYFHQAKNELGYRDKSVEKWSRDQNLIKVLCLGDSYTDGNGVRFIRNRYDKKLETLLNSRQNKSLYSVRIAGEPGWGTAEEFNALKKFPSKPDIVILQYYINDLDSYIEKNSNVVEKDFMSIIASKLPLMGKLSYAANFFYFANSQLWMQWENLEGETSNQFIKKHLEEIDSLFNHLKVNNIQGYVLFLPDIVSLYSYPGVKEGIVLLCEKYNISFLDETNVLEMMPIEERVVNKYDAHASAAAHEKFALELSTQI